MYLDPWLVNIYKSQTCDVIKNQIHGQIHGQIKLIKVETSYYMNLKPELRVGTWDGKIFFPIYTCK